MWLLEKVKEKHTPPIHEEKKRRVCVSTMNQDEEGKKYTLSRDNKTKGGLRTANTDGGGQKHKLPGD